MLFKSLPLFFLLFSVIYGCSGRSDNSADSSALTPQQLLGKQLFFDIRLSEPVGQACASCHHPDAGFALPPQRPLLAVSPGANPVLFGNRNTPTIRYAAYIPALHYDKKEQVYVGGLFLDGRKNSLELQATGPLFNPVEMALPNKAALLARLKEAGYEKIFRKVYGETAMINEQHTVSQLTLALAAYQRSKELSPFSSKYDAYLQGKAELSAQEKRGLDLFNAEDKGNCAACHPSEKSETGQPPLFTDFTYDNLGVPANPQNPFYKQSSEVNPDGENYVDTGLGAIVNDKLQNGKFRVPTLRNIALTAPYMHNGVFETLEEVVDFYNTRDTKKWPKPEVAENVNKDELGDLKLTKQEVEDLVAFMKTLTDGYKVK